MISTFSVNYKAFYCLDLIVLNWKAEEREDSICRRFRQQKEHDLINYPVSQTMSHSEHRQLIAGKLNPQITEPSADPGVANSVPMVRP